jgi:hypothetical protein
VQESVDFYPSVRAFSVAWGAANGWGENFVLRGGAVDPSCR